MKKLIIVFILGLAFFACQTASDTQSWTLSGELTGGSGTDTSYTVKDGETVTLTSPTREGYVFSGWNSSSDGTGTVFVSGETKVTGNATIYAIWKKKILITFNISSGNKTFTAVEGESFVLPAELPGYEYRRLSIDANLEKLSWQDQFLKPYVATQKITQSLTYTQTWVTVTTADFINDVIGVWAFSDKSQIYFVKKNTALADSILVYNCGKSDSTPYTDAEIAGLDGTSCPPYPASGNPLENTDSLSRGFFSWGVDYIERLTSTELGINYLNGRILHRYK